MAHPPRVLTLASALLLATGLAAASVPAGIAAPAAAARARPTAVASPRVNPARLPLAFTRNDGQASRDVRYFGQSQGVSVLFTSTGVTLDLARDPALHTAGQHRQRQARAQVTLTFRHASPHPRITGASREPGTVNYFTGRNPARWHTRIPAYAKVVYHGLWPGITATFTTRNGTLKYWFTLAPGARASQIRLAYTGARHLAITRAGALTVTTPAGTLTDQAPATTQALRGHQTELRSRYRLTGRTGFGYILARHPGRAAVTIDPGLGYSTFLGGSAGSTCAGANDDIAVDSIQTDAAGDLYLFGHTCSASFPTTPGAYRTSNPHSLSFVTKFNPTGTALIYSTFVGGTHGGVGAYFGPLSESLGAVDSSGDAYVTGPTLSTDFPTTHGAYQTRPDPVTSQRGSSVSVAFKLNPAGTRLVYSTYLSGVNVSDGALGPGGALTVTGSTSSDLMPVTPGAFQTQYPGGWSTGYVARLNATGTGLIYSTYLGAPITRQILSPNNSGAGQNRQACWLGDFAGVAVDARGAAYIAGTCSPGFPTTAGAYQRTGTDDWLGTGDMLLVSLNPSGTRLRYATYYDTPADAQSGSFEFSGAVQVDNSGDAYIGTTYTSPGSVPVTLGAYASNCPTGDPSCTSVAKFNPTGGLAYSTYFPGIATGLAIDDSGNAYIAGNGADIPTTPNAYSTKPGDFQIPFYLAVIGKGGGSLLYGSYFGGANQGVPVCTPIGCISGPSGYLRIAPHVTGSDVYLGGETNASNFPVTPGAYQTTYPNALDAGFADELTLPSLSAAVRHGGYKLPSHRATRQPGRPLTAVALGR